MEIAMPATFIDANILFRMFATTTFRLERFNSSGSSGSKSLDHAINIQMKLRDGTETYLTSELALLEACVVASVKTSSEKSAQSYSLRSIRIQIKVLL
jgi:hypothetical protein